MQPEGEPATEETRSRNRRACRVPDSGRIRRAASSSSASTRARTAGATATRSRGRSKASTSTLDRDRQRDLPRRPARPAPLHDPHHRGEDRRRGRQQGRRSGEPPGATCDAGRRSTSRPNTSKRISECSFPSIPTSTASTTSRARPCAPREDPPRSPRSTRGSRPHLAPGGRATAWCVAGERVDDHRDDDPRQLPVPGEGAARGSTRLSNSTARSRSTGSRGLVRFVNSVLQELRDDGRLVQLCRTDSARRPPPSHPPRSTSRDHAVADLGARIERYLARRYDQRQPAELDHDRTVSSSSRRPARQDRRRLGRAVRSRRREWCAAFGFLDAPPARVSPRTRLAPTKRSSQLPRRTVDRVAPTTCPSPTGDCCRSCVAPGGARATAPRDDGQGLRAEGRVVRSAQSGTRPRVTAARARQPRCPSRMTGAGRARPAGRRAHRSPPSIHCHRARCHRAPASRRRPRSLAASANELSGRLQDELRARVLETVDAP